MAEVVVELPTVVSMTNNMLYMLNLHGNYFQAENRAEGNFLNE